MFNLVSGIGPVVGEAIAAHPDVDMVSFTGSTRAGQRVAELAAGTVKRVALELGGKSANVILPDADLEQAVNVGRGQLLPQLRPDLHRLDPHARAPRRQAEAGRDRRRGGRRKYRVGDPLPTGPRLGPLVSAAQRDRVRGYIQQGVAEGASSSPAAPSRPRAGRGYFVRPTVFADVTPDMTIAQEEIFGPVLSVIPYDDDDEAVEIANDTLYGLAGGVWSADQDRRRSGRPPDAHRPGRHQRRPVQPAGAVRRLQAVGHTAGSTAAYGFEEFLETKSLLLQRGPSANWRSFTGRAESGKGTPVRLSWPGHLVLRRPRSCRPAAGALDLVTVMPTTPAACNASDFFETMRLDHRSHEMDHCSSCRVGVERDRAPRCGQSCSPSKSTRWTSTSSARRRERAVGGRPTAQFL